MSIAARTVVLASRNQDKLRELREICADLPLNVVSSLDFPGLPEIIEDGTTALGNATRKAIVTAAFTGEIAVADDTTFQIRILGGIPDVFASRFAGPEARYEDNAELVLDLLRAVPDDCRDARFETSMVWVDPRPVPRPELRDIAPAQAAWLHNPFSGPDAAAAAIGGDATGIRLSDRRRTWADYRASLGVLPDGWGIDHRRVLEIIDRLVAPFLEGGRPADAPPGAMQLPDTRLWLVGDPQDPLPAPNLPEPPGLPDDAFGRALSRPIWLELSAAGRLLGRIGRQPLGSGGFGYDPIFFPEGQDRTLAEMAPQEKNAISHRAKAMRRLAAAAAHAYGLAEAGV
jgi:inosine/xanthosine triphosphate pyrophosphatase family protein